MMRTALSSDILEAQFGPTLFKIIAQGSKRRISQTSDASSGQILEQSKVRFRAPGSRQFPSVHNRVLAGESMGKAFKSSGIAFIRSNQSVSKKLVNKYSLVFKDNRPVTVVKVVILVGPDQLPYADIEETYSPAVNWPETYNVLIINNYDSFTYNLYQQIAALGYHVQVVNNDSIGSDQIRALSPSHIIISPGPKGPPASGISLEVIRRFHKTVPILGVCLGHQCIAQVFGSRVVKAQLPVHGKTDKIWHTGEGLFLGLPKPFEVARYHSLIIDQLPPDFSLGAWSSDGSIMAINHNQYPLYGVQFHPESFMTKHGELIIRNFFDAVR